MGFFSEIGQEIAELKPGRRDLRNLGLVFCVAFCVLAGISIWKQGAAWPWLLAVAGLMLALGLLLPAALRPLYKVWMGFAVVMGFFMSRIILTVVFYLVVTPIGLFMRLLGKDLLDRKWDRDAPTYWKQRERGAFDRQRAEKMY